MKYFKKGYNRIKRLLLGGIMRLILWKNKACLSLFRLGFIIEYSLSTLISLAVGVFLICSPAQLILAQNTILSDIFIGIGTLIGTIIALMLTISLIPIQKAAEIFTPSVVGLCRDDSISRAIILVISVFGLLSFCMAINGVFGISHTLLLPIQIIMLGITLDLIRWHHRRVSVLLEPAKGIDILWGKIRHHIDYCAKKVTLIVWVQSRLGSAEEKVEYSKEDLECTIFRQMPGNIKVLNNWTSELAEIAIKAINRNEIFTAQLATSKLTELALYYLAKRKNNMLMGNARYSSTVENDINLFLNPIYASLDEINKKAMAQQMELVAKNTAMMAYYYIIRDILRLQSPAFKDQAWFIILTPLNYLTFAIDSAQTKGLVDISAKGSEIYLSIAKDLIEVEEEIETTTTINTIIGLWEKMIKDFVASNQPSAGGAPLMHLIILASYVINRPSSHQARIVKDVFYSLERLALCIHESEDLRIILRDFLYNSRYPTSIFKMVQMLIQNITKEKAESREKNVCYQTFLDINQRLSQHMRIIAGRVDIDRSGVIWEITQSIRSIVETCLWCIENMQGFENRFRSEVEKQIKMYLSFFWVAFSKAVSINSVDANNAAFTVSFLGLQCLRQKCDDIAEVCISNIFSIAASYYKLSQGQDLFTTSDVLLQAYYIRIYADKIGNNEVVKKYDSQFNTFNAMLGENQLAFQEIFESRTCNLQKDLMEGTNISEFSIDSLMLLKQLIDELEPGQIENQQ